jgi:hypothetical protein
MDIYKIGYLAGRPEEPPATRPQPGVGAPERRSCRSLVAALPGAATPNDLASLVV